MIHQNINLLQGAAEPAAPCNWLQPDALSISARGYREITFLICKWLILWISTLEGMTYF